jgi:hypothetical protein
MACRPAGPGCGPVFPPDGPPGLVADSRDGRSGLPRATGLSRSAGRLARRGRRRLPARPGPAVRCAAHPVAVGLGAEDGQRPVRIARSANDLGAGPPRRPGRAASFWASRAACSARARALVRRPVPGRPHRPDRHRSNCMARRPASCDAIFWRIHGEVPSSPGTVAPGHDGYASGLRDRPADQELPCMLTTYSCAEHALACQPAAGKRAGASGRRAVTQGCGGVPDSSG